MCHSDVLTISIDAERYSRLSPEIRTKIYEYLALSISVFQQTNPVYEYIKNILLDAVTGGVLDIHDMERILHDIHLIRSAIESVDKASRLLERIPTGTKN